MANFSLSPSACRMITLIASFSAFDLSKTTCTVIELLCLHLTRAQHIDLLGLYLRHLRTNRSKAASHLAICIDANMLHMRWSRVLAECHRIVSHQVSRIRLHAVTSWMLVRRCIRTTLRITVITSMAYTASELRLAHQLLCSPLVSSLTGDLRRDSLMTQTCNLSAARSYTCKVTQGWVLLFLVRALPWFAGWLLSLNEQSLKRCHHRSLCTSKLLRSIQIWLSHGRFFHILEYLQWRYIFILLLHNHLVLFGDIQQSCSLSFFIRFHQALIWCD